MKILKLNNISKDYNVSGGFLQPNKKLKALSNITLEIQKGETLAVVGESGCGKSTLARIITMIENPTQGEIFLHGQSISSLGMSKKNRTAIQIVFQDPYGSLNPRQKIGDILEEPLIINQIHLGKIEIEKKAR